MKISKDDYLKALGLFTLATEASKKAQEYEAALCILLGREGDYAGHISDAVWSAEQGKGVFDEALKKEGYEVEGDDR